MMYTTQAALDPKEKKACIKLPYPPVPTKIETWQWFVTDYSNSTCLDHGVH